MHVEFVRHLRTLCRPEESYRKS